MADVPSGQVAAPYSIPDLYAQAFGYIKPPYPQVSIIPKLNPLGTVKALRGAFQFKSSIGNEYTSPITIDGWQVPCEPVIGVYGSKNIIETRLTRLNSITNAKEVQNIIEESNLNNYRIRIRGVIYNEDQPDEYPEEAVRRMHQLFEKPGNVVVVNGILQIHDITKMIIQDISWKELPGFPGAQPYEMDCLSDETDDYPLELI